MLPMHGHDASAAPCQIHRPKNNEVETKGVAWKKDFIKAKTRVNQNK